ncbi:LysR family transcriptional regulator [Paraburkholderia sp. Tr-20389]|uniref:LysR family transcriptional regulator n=1 Tax=Paraburkholderia sp. Tr-20389 TaxID=2703903 RepID=UPI001980635F|nr:LysR family transcriptional regulator [Paraburkholderia sp. Tr-20389]MBN3756593.1 LysR family transcriptional regulator [Paraburkholderia sp. Tr-20389]
MDNVDLNLLVALDVLLAEGSVTRAAHRLGLSSSAMSRTLARLRAATGDPLLVRAGRGLVPTPYAAALRDRVHELTRDAQAMLRPQSGQLDVASLDLSFTIRASEAFIEFFSVPLWAAIAEAAPRVRLCFAAKPNKDAGPLREGMIDLEIGLIETSAPEMCTEVLFHDRFVGVVRAGHPLLAGERMTPERYAACKHVVASRRGDFTGPVDEALDKLGLRREIAVVVPGFPDAMRIARHSDLVALVPQSSLGNALAGDHAAGLGLQAFDLPVKTPAFTISAMWHPRVDADPAHRWLRSVVMSLCRAAYPASREQ